MLDLKATYLILIYCVRLNHKASAIGDVH